MAMPTDGYTPITADVLVDVFTAAEYTRVFRYSSTVTVQAETLKTDGDTVLAAVVQTIIDQAKVLLDPAVAYTTNATITYNGQLQVDALPPSGGV